jgi:hypothetical protein
MMPDCLFNDPDVIAYLCRRHAMRRLSLPGAAIDWTARPDSDADFWVEPAKRESA